MKKKSECNINNLATVTLTEKGKEILKNHYSRYSLVVNIKPDNTYTTELWSLFNVFGKFLYNGCEIPFEENKILIEVDE